MKFKFYGDIAGLEKGIEIFKEKFSFTTGDDGFPVEVIKTDETKLEASFKAGEGKIVYNEKFHFFRALTLFLEGISYVEPFEINEEPQFNLVGPMFDVSRNAVLTVDSIKKYIYYLAAMGINMMMLYTEDTYTIDDYPYFGYMRGRYTYEELKECDDYADIFGIEIIPCIQTLAHLEQALKWPYAEPIKDTEDILLVGEEKTYEFIEKMIESASAPFRSNKIHIGMDEAHNLGLGRYLDKNGYRRRFDIMTEHLNRVVSICKKLDLEPMMWSDMFFRLGSEVGDYDQNADIPEDVIENLPEEVKLVYWDYYNRSKDHYLEFIKQHKKFGHTPVFAGGMWTWNGLVPHYEQTFETTNAALSACKDEGVEDIIATMWGDNGAETNLFTGILGLLLFAEHAYAKEVDVEEMKGRFKFLTGVDAKYMEDIQSLDVIPGITEGGIDNPSKYLLWQDILIGLFDKHVEDLDLAKYYSEVAYRMDCYRKAFPKWQLLFDMPYHLADVLALKVDMGCRIKDLYDKDDKEALKAIATEELPTLYEKVDALRKSHRTQWMTTNKPFGWDVLDIRYGGLLARVDTAIARISDYVDGNIDSIEELEAKRLYFDGRSKEEHDPKKLPHCNLYRKISSACPL